MDPAPQGKIHYFSDENYRRRAVNELAKIKKAQPKTRQTVEKIEQKLRKMDQDAGLWREFGVQTAAAVPPVVAAPPPRQVVAAPPPRQVVAAPPPRQVVAAPPPPVVAAPPPPVGPHPLLAPTDYEYRHWLDPRTYTARQRDVLYYDDTNYKRRGESALAKLKRTNPKTRKTALELGDKIQEADKEARVWRNLQASLTEDDHFPPLSATDWRALVLNEFKLREYEEREEEARREVRRQLEEQQRAAARQLEELEDAQFRAAAPAAPAAAAADGPKPKRKPRAPIMAEAGPAEAGPAEAGPANKPKRKPRAPKPVDRDAIRGKMTKSGGFRTTVYKDPSPAHPKKAYVGKAVETKGVRVAQNEEKPRAKKVAYAGTRSNFAKWFGL